MLELLQNTFVGVHELRTKLTTLLSSVKDKGNEVVITQQGKPVALLMSIERYLELKQAMKEFSDPEYLAELMASKQEIREGKGIPAEEVFAKKGL